MPNFSYYLQVATHFLPNYKNPCWRQPGESELRCLPYFYLVGVSKSGTTDLYMQLKKHPKIARGNTKELGYWGKFRKLRK